MLAILVLATVWLLVIAGVVVLCFAAKQGDEALDARRFAQGSGDVVPLVIARRHVARTRSVAGSAR
jgi:hypothetical protein